MKDLINWEALSRHLTGKGGNIRRDNIPEKYKQKVNNLVKAMCNWDFQNNIAPNYQDEEFDEDEYLLSLRK